VIPQRILLEGFLCYKEPQEIEFDSHSSLWMLSGLNGSGKSSIFDAVTFALFGHHRGGGQNYQDLINKDCDRLLVELDFLLDGQSYRIKRTQRRKKGGGTTGTQQVFRFDPQEPDPKKKWKPVEDLGGKTDFNNWIGDRIGLNYETFTSSVLLLQGKAEKLLDSKPEGRRTVLASIVDLERYERLHAEADEERKKVEGRLHTLEGRRNALPAVADEQLELARQGIATAEEIRKQAREEVARLQALEFKAREWRELQGRLAQARQRWQEACRLLQESDAIAKDVARLRELRDVLPCLHLIAKQRVVIHNAETAVGTLAKDQQQAREKVETTASALQQSRSKRVTLQEQIERAQENLKRINAQLLEVRLQMDRLKQYERHEAELARLREDLAQLPGDPAKEVTLAQEQVERLSEASRIVPILERFQRRRGELRQSVTRSGETQRQLEQIKERGARYKADLDRLVPQLEEATRELQAATDRATEARTLLSEAQKSLRETTHLEGSTRCRHCGQELTPGHIEQEKRRRGAAVRQAQDEERKAKEAQQAAQAREQQVRSQHTQADKNRQDARMEYQTAQAQFKQAQQDIDRLRGECAQVHAELPEPYHRIHHATPSDWLETTYPTDSDLETARTEAAQLATARQALKRAEQAYQQWTRLESQRTATLASLEALGKDLPADRQGVRKNHSRLDADVKAVEQTLLTHQANLKDTEAEIDRLTRAREEAQKCLSDFDTRFRREEMTKQLAQQAIHEQQKMLSPAWLDMTQHVGMTDLHRLDREKDDLEAKKTDERGRQLEQARGNVDLFKSEVETLEAQEPTFPEEARQAPELIRKDLETARRQDAECDEEVGKSREQLALLEHYRKERHDLDEKCKQTEGELNELKLLAELLGRNRLQLFLVRQAERQVVEHANAVLDRLSGGQLYLKLSGEANGEGNAAKALELEAYNRMTGDKPINVNFLSGSQKFRVAVSLALGIGQYASRQHRPIESVIIDEGFGCLDAQGRQVMIQELNTLRSQMRCILLVSHQEEFADAFSDGYHFSLRNGATHVERFQK
jgi:exonuclease SbcC